MPRGEHVWFEPDHKSFGAFMRSEQMRDVTADVCSDIATRAGELAPKGGSDVYESGSDVPLSANFKVEREAGYLTIGARQNTRVMCTVINTSRHAAITEFGGRADRHKRHRMLGRAGAEFGDFKPDGGPSTERGGQ